MRKRPARLLRDENGATMVEITIVMTMFLIVTFGLVEFAFALWQWNSASKATQLGGRLAAVSDPVWPNLMNMTGNVGGTVPAYDVECSGGLGGTCSDGSSLVDNALLAIVEGRDGQCPTDPDFNPQERDGFPGMCDIFYRVEPENVVVRYYNSGLGFAGRPGGPVPTITVRLTGLQFDFVALGPLLGFGPMTMPDFEVTMTGEDLCVQSPSSC